MRPLTEDELSEYNELKPKSDTWDLLAWVFIVLIIGIALGYAYRYAQEPLQYEQGYIEGIEEIAVAVRGEICDGLK